MDHDAPVEVAENVTVGHQCLLHGCTIEKGALIGMGSTILNHAVIGENSLIGAGSLSNRRKSHPTQCIGFWPTSQSDPPLRKKKSKKIGKISSIMSI